LATKVAGGRFALLLAAMSGTERWLAEAGVRDSGLAHQIRGGVNQVPKGWRIMPPVLLVFFPVRAHGDCQGETHGAQPPFNRAATSHGNQVFERRSSDDPDPDESISFRQHRRDYGVKLLREVFQFATIFLVRVRFVCLGVVSTKHRGLTHHVALVEVWPNSNADHHSMGVPPVSARGQFHNGDLKVRR